MNLHGYLAREGIAYGPEGLDFTNLYFYTITWHALHTSMKLARERNQPSPALNSRATPAASILTSICRATGSQKQKSSHAVCRAALRCRRARCGTTA
jgi:ribonucleoside-diphosphate reductase alpha chain